MEFIIFFGKNLVLLTTSWETETSSMEPSFLVYTTSEVIIDTGQDCVVPQSFKVLRVVSSGHPIKNKTAGTH